MDGRCIGYLYAPIDEKAEQLEEVADPLSSFDESETTEPHKMPALLGFFPTLMNVINTLSGPEVLSISNSMTLLGFIPSVLLMTITAVLSYIGTMMVLMIRQRVDVDSVNNMATTIMGKWWGQAFSIVTLCFTYSCQVEYIVMGTETVTNWITLAGFTEWGDGWRHYLLSVLYSLLVPIALSIPREIKVLSYISTWSIVCEALYFFAIIIKGAQMFPDQGINPTVESWSFGIVFFNAFSIYSTMYALAAVILPMVRNYTPDLRKRSYLIGTSYVSVFLLTLIPGAIGYLIFGSSTNEILISSFSSKDILIQVVRIGFFIVINASFQAVSVTVMTDISSVMFRHFNPATLPWGKRIVALIVSDLPPLVIGALLPSVRPAIMVGGALGGCLSNFFFPPLLWVYLSKKRWFNWRNLLMIAFAGFGLISAVIATYEAILDAIDSS